MKRYIISVSGGAPSAWCALWASVHYPKEQIELVFADTRAEDPDNYRFLRDLEKVLGLKITRLVDGRTPLQVGEDENYIPTQAFATCTFRLKTELILKHVDKLKKDGYEIEMIIGYDLTDQKRVAKTVNNWHKAGIVARFPIIETNTQDPKGELEELHGLRLPRTYTMGFKHANCIGMGGCVKFGKKDTILMIENFPKEHRKKELWEKKMLLRRHIQRVIVWKAWAKVVPHLMHKKPEIKMYTFLRDGTGRYPDGLSLEQFRLDYEKEKQDKTDLRPFMLQADLDGCST